MVTSAQSPDVIQPTGYGRAGSLVRPAVATPRAQGARRYQCPVTGSFVLVTDEAQLAGIDSPRGRLRCVDCGEVHLLTQEVLE